MDKAPATVVPVTTGGFVGMLVGFLMFELNTRAGVKFSDYEVATITTIITTLAGWLAHSYLLRKFTQLLDEPKETPSETKTATTVANSATPAAGA